MTIFDIFDAFFNSFTRLRGHTSAAVFLPKPSPSDITVKVLGQTFHLGLTVLFGDTDKQLAREIGKKVIPDVVKVNDNSDSATGLISVQEGFNVYGITITTQDGDWLGNIVFYRRKNPFTWQDASLIEKLLRSVSKELKNYFDNLIARKMN